MRKSTHITANIIHQIAVWHDIPIHQSAKLTSGSSRTQIAGWSGRTDTTHTTASAYATSTRATNSANDSRNHFPTQSVGRAIIRFNTGKHLLHISGRIGNNVKLLANKQGIGHINDRFNTHGKNGGEYCRTGDIRRTERDLTRIGFVGTGIHKHIYGIRLIRKQRKINDIGYKIVRWRRRQIKKVTIRII